jgi:diguanylate cyclase (GGDEF)-like protein
MQIVNQQCNFKNSSKGLHSQDDALIAGHASDIAGLEQRLRDATFISRFMGATCASLVPQDICAIAARHLYDFIPYRSIIFTLAPEFGLTPFSFAPEKGADCLPLKVNEATWSGRSRGFMFDERLQGSMIPGSSASIKEVDIHLPDSLGTVRIFFSSLSIRTLSPALLAEVAAHFSRTLKNALLHEQVKELAMKDALTGLYNRRVFDELLAVEMRRKALMPISLLLIDLDDFKKVNDTFGHPAGDEVLSTVGKILREGCRGSDLVARYGGEEFAVMLPSTNSAVAFEIAQRLRTRIAGTIFVFNGKQLRLTASIGIAFTSGGRSDPITQLVSRADEALYRAKNNGKNSTIIYTPKTADISKRAIVNRKQNATWLKSA